MIERRSAGPASRPQGAPVYVLCAGCTSICQSFVQRLLARTIPWISLDISLNDGRCANGMWITLIRCAQAETGLIARNNDITMPRLTLLSLSFLKSPYREHRARHPAYWYHTA
jgi:hypothetical protein